MPLRRFTKTETVVTERRRMERPLLIMVWLSVALLSLAEGGTFYLLAATLAVGINLTALFSRREIFLNRWLVNAAVVLSSGVLVTELLSRESAALLALGHYLVLILLCKLFERKSNRDYVQLMAMSWLVVIAAAVRCDELWFALGLLVYVTLACYTAMVFTLKRGLDTVASARLANEAAPLAPQRVAWNVIRGWPGSALRRRTALMMIFMLIMGVILFLVTPRGATGLSAASVSGNLDRSLILGDAGKIYLSEKIVMTVRTTKGNAGGYLRGRTFSSYRHSQWTAVETGQTDISSAAIPPNVLKRAITQEIRMSPDLLPVAYGAGAIIYVDYAKGNVGVSSSGLSLKPWSLTGGSVRYRVFTAPAVSTPSQRRWLAEMPGERFRDSYVDVRPKVHDLAQKWCEDLLGESQVRDDRLNLRIARRIASKLARRCEYTLDLSDAEPDRDGVEDFLFHMKKGHCEYFASAEAVMCRSLGVPARVAVGFYTDSQTRSDGSYDVRLKDAHAWCEVYTAAGWVVVDATPPARWEESSSRWGIISRWWMRAKFSWRDTILRYDTDAREHLGRWLAIGLGSIWAVVVSASLAIRGSFMNLMVGGYVDLALYRLGMVLVALTAVVAGVLFWRAASRALAMRRTDGRGRVSPKQWAFARKLFRMLSRRDRRRPPHQTPREWALRSAERLSLPCDSVAELVELYYRLRWGRSEIDPDSIKRAEKLTTDLIRTRRRIKRKAAITKIEDARGTSEHTESTENRNK